MTGRIWAHAVDTAAGKVVNKRSIFGLRDSLNQEIFLECVAGLEKYMKNKPYFPMFIDLSDKNIVVVGGGNIATRRVKTLLSFTKISESLLRRSPWR